MTLLLCMQFRVPWHTVLDKPYSSFVLGLLPVCASYYTASNFCGLLPLLSRALNRLEELNRFAVPYDDF